MVLGKTKPVKWEIFETKDYGLFELIPCNRQINHNHLRNLTEAIQVNNQLREHPIRVRPNGMILDGQHRLLAAKELGVTLYYYIDENKTDVMDIADEAAVRRTWTLNDSLYTYVQLGLPHYMALQEFMDKHPWITVSVAVAICQGKRSNSFLKGENRRAFRRGEYKITDMRFAIQFACAIGDFMEYVEFAKHKRFMQTISYLLRHPAYDHNRMMAQMERAGHQLTRQFTKNDYLRVMEKIYNYRKTEKFRERFF